MTYTANFQVINGVNIGKIFPLNIPMTIIGESGSGVVVIVKRKGGFFISILEEAAVMTFNQQPLSHCAVKLNHKDVLAIGNQTIQFYLQ